MGCGEPRMNFQGRNFSTATDLNPGPSDQSDTLTTDLLRLWWQRNVGLMFIS